MGEYKKEMDVFDRLKARDRELYRIDRDRYLNDLDKPFKLYNMDDINRHVGVTVKFWWQRHLGRQSGKRILDLGAGNSYHSPYWISKGNTVVMTDISFGTLSINRDIIIESLRFPGRLIQNDAEHLCFKKGTFDLINMNLFLHHVPSIPKVLAGAYEVLKDDGHLLVVEPNHFFPLRFMYECPFLRRYNPVNNFLWKTGHTGRDDRGMLYSELKADIERAGFEIILTDYDKNFFGYAFGYFFPKMKRLIRMVYYFDRAVTFLMPRSLTNFIYIIARKKREGLSDGRGEEDRALADTIATKKMFSFAWRRFGRDEVSKGWFKDSFAYMNYIPQNVFSGTEGKIALDVGCGSGADMIDMHRKGYETVGIDISDAVHEARKNTHGLGGVHIVQASVYEMPFKDDRFDLVYSFGVLHHLPDPERGFKTLCDKAKRSGWVIIYVYEDFSERSFLERVLLRTVNSLRAVTPKMPPRPLYLLCIAMSPLVLLFCCMPYRILKRFGSFKGIAEKMPFRHTARLDCIVADLYDRFSPPIELRYSRSEVTGWFNAAGFEDVHVVNHRGWVAWGRKR